jgi:hypothetical protein
MTKKTFDCKLRATVGSQDKALQDRFDKADSILMKSSANAVERAVPKPSVIRDTFSMPPNDYALIENLRSTAAKSGRIATKSEIIRSGLQALSMLEGPQLVAALNGLQKVLPGRKS